MKVVSLTVIIFTVLTIVIANIRPPQKKIDHQIEISYDVSNPQFFRSMGNLLGPPIVPGNKVTALKNGIEIFPAMLKAIASAKSTINFESYIYWSGEIGDQFVNALSERARAGVKVSVLVDWVGSQKMDDTYIEKMKEAGIKIEMYHPLRWYNVSRMNNRTHRKILVVDGRIGFTGGVGISDEWAGNAEEPNQWRDTHFLVEGPVVAQLQAAFTDNGLKTWSEVPHDESYFPELQPVGKSWAQVFQSSAREGSASATLMYLMAIAAAKKNIRLSSAYFVPDELAIKEMIKAKERGVSIQVIVPGPYTDADTVGHASRAQWGELLKAGIEIYQYQPSRYHCKVMIIDDYFVTVGSTNFDNRSFRLNDESNLNIFDEEFAKEQSKAFEEDKGNSRKVTYEEWENRDLKEIFQEKLATLIKSQL